MAIQQQAATVVAEDIVAFKVVARLWTGSRRLKKADLQKINPALAQLPPKSLATLGSVKLIDPILLKPFKDLKYQAIRLLQESSLPIFGWDGVPKAKALEITQNLQALEKKWNEAVDVLLKNLVDAIDKWRNLPENAKWKELISGVPDTSDIRGRLTFGCEVASLSAPPVEVIGETKHEAFHSKFGGLKGELFLEVNTVAQKMRTDSLVGEKNGVVGPREYITPKTLRILRRLEEKVRGFAFLDPSVGPLADLIDHVLNSCAGIPRISGPKLTSVWTLVNSLSSPEQVEQVANVAFASENDMGDVMDQLAAPVVHVVDEDDGADEVDAASAVAALPALSVVPDLAPTSAAVEVEEKDDAHPEPVQVIPSPPQVNYRTMSYM